MSVFRVVITTEIVSKRGTMDMSNRSLLLQGRMFAKGEVKKEQAEMKKIERRRGPPETYPIPEDST